MISLSAEMLSTPHNIAPLARITASSEIAGHACANVTDGIIRIDGKGEWIADTRLDSRGRAYPFPWIRMEWEKPVHINKVIIYDRPAADCQTAGGRLTFSDGSTIAVNCIPDNGAPKVVEFESRETKWIEFQVTDGEGKQLGLSEIEVYPAPESYSDYVSWVDPFIETARGRYFFFVTGSIPFGMISSAPLTRNINQGGGGYNYNSDKILGFPQIHNWMISGLSLMPVSGTIDPCSGDKGWRSSFSHDGEIVQPGYHRLFLDDYGIWVEQTATDRVGFYRMTYTEESKASLLLNLGGHISTSTMSGAHVVKMSENEISGYFETSGRVWGGVDKARVYFTVQFDRPFMKMDGWKGNSFIEDVDEWDGSDEIIKVEGSSFRQSPESGVAADFGKLSRGEILLAKTAVSYVSIENARENLAEDCASWDFDAVRENARSVWNGWLGRIEVKGGEHSQKIKLYTDLWHVLLGRHKIDDANGEYPDYLTGGERIGRQTRIHTVAPDFHVRTLPKDADGKVCFHMYNSDALWLTQWNLNTLWGLAYPSVLDEFSASFLEYDRNGGLLPRGPSIGSYTYIMTGCPATSMITSAYQRGIFRKWDPESGFKAMKRNHEKGGMLAFDMDDELDFYIKHGYCPDNAGLTIQWAFEDWALGQMALKMGRMKDFRYFDRRSHGWVNSFNKDLKLVMPRRKDGSWLHLDPLSYSGYIQANAWQATFGLSHDIPELARLMGGNDSLCIRLDEAFRKSEESRFLGSYANYANQPGCSNAHVFLYAGHPELANYWVRQVRMKTYGEITPDRGYGENDEDQGQMAGISALMSIGLFSLDGGSCAEPSYDITSPLFDEIIIHLDENYYSGKTFTIRTYGNGPDNCQIRSMKLDGKPYEKFRIPHSLYAKGGLLELWLGK